MQEFYEVRRLLIAKHPDATDFAKFRNDARSSNDPNKKSDDDMLSTTYEAMVSKYEHELMRSAAIAFAEKGLRVDDVIFDGLHVWLPADTKDETGIMQVSRVAEQVTEKVREAMGGWRYFVMRVKTFKMPSWAPVSRLTGAERQELGQQHKEYLKQCKSGREHLLDALIAKLSKATGLARRQLEQVIRSNTHTPP